MWLGVRSNKGTEIEIRDAKVTAEVLRVLGEMLAEANGTEVPIKRGPGRPPKTQAAGDLESPPPEQAS
jgi:hypothetical protein